MTNLRVFKTKKKNIAVLIHKRTEIKCFVGVNGIGKKIREGDKRTPTGTFTFSEVFYRPDKIKLLNVNLPMKKIYKNSFWCVDSKSRFYNQHRGEKNNYTCEKLYRDDHLYDIFITLNFNTDPTRKYKGSAIFIHCCDAKKRYTDGCLAFEKEKIIEILGTIKPYSKLLIY